MKVSVTEEFEARIQQGKERRVLTLDQDRAIGAARRGAERFCEVLASATDPDAPAVGHWRVRDVGAHLVGVRAYTAMLRGEPSPASSIDEITSWNAGTVAVASRPDCASIAAEVHDAFEEFFAESQRHAADELVGWHGAVQLPVSSVSAVLAGEAYVHGRDVARALGRPWPLDADDMRTIFVGLLPVLPHYVDRDGAVGFAASFDVRLRGDPTSRARFEFDTGHLTVRQCGGGRVDCRVSAEPATFVLILYGRSGLLRPVLTGRVVASGRKPWLGLTLPRRFRRP